MAQINGVIDGVIFSEREGGWLPHKRRDGRPAQKKQVGSRWIYRLMEQESPQSRPEPQDKEPDRPKMPAQASRSERKPSKSKAEVFPYQMSLEQFTEHVEKRGIIGTLDDKKRRAEIATIHRLSIENALADGLSVPEDILAAYQAGQTAQRKRRP